MLKIGDFSKLSRISIRMLRHYNEIGLLIPADTDEFTGYRYYNEAQLPDACRINELKNMGFSLSTITKILKEYNNPEKMRQYLLVKQSELEEQAEETNKRLLFLKTAIERLRKDGKVMNYNVVLKEIPTRLVASVRKIIPAYDQEGMLWEILRNETKEQKIVFADPSYSLATYYEEGYKEHDVDTEIQIAVKGSYKNTEHVIFKTVPSVQVASATYQGSYDKITQVFEAVANWMKDNSYEIAGPMLTIYHVSPAQTQNPDELVTEICFPLKKGQLL